MMKGFRDQFFKSIVGKGIIWRQLNELNKSEWFESSIFKTVCYNLFFFINLPFIKEKSKSNLDKLVASNKESFNYN